jgi:hypothetical protein
MSIRKSFILVVSTILLFTSLGGLIGFCLGRFLPNYYRTVFRDGNDPGFDPISVGLSLGLTQGIVAGTIVGVAVLLVRAWQDRRTCKGNTNVGVRKKLNAGTRRFLKVGGISIAVIVIPFIIFFGLWFASSYGSDRGSPELASEWRQLLSEFRDPNSAVDANERIWVIQCDNDEWMFGLAQGSHGIWKHGGGTVVTKDSNGELRSYRGHVCWPSGSPFRGCSTENLANVYEQIDDLGFEALASESVDENERPDSSAQTKASPSPGL